VGPAHPTLMSYLVLARKWRPKSFDDVVGQATVTRTLKNALASGRIGHAFLLSGARGVGKTTTARILAMALNCSRGEAPTPEPCGECASCREIVAGGCLDVQEIDGATNNSVDQVRELRESARYNPARDRFKVWIIDEVHMLSTGAFNALLKTLEEPPPRVKFIFATTEYHKIPDTILSRCQQYDFRLIPARELLAHLRRVADGEEIRVSDEALVRIARSAEGSARDALSLFDQVLSFSGSEVKDEDIQALLGLVDRELLLTASRAVADGDSLAALALVERLSDYGADYRNFTRELLLHLRELLLLTLAPDTSPLLAQIVPEERERMRSVAEAFSEEELLRAIDLLTKADAELRAAQDPRVTLELALLKLVQLQRLMPFAALVERVERLAAGIAPEARPSPARAAAKPEASAPLPRPSSEPPMPTAPKAVAAAAEAPVAAAPRADTEEALLAAMLAAVQARPSLAQPLRGARARLAGSILNLEISGDFAAFASMHLEEYRQIASTAAGRPLQVTVSAGAGNELAAAPSPADLRRERLMKEAAREPAVQEALDLFGGRVVDVRDTEP
jgi:DNA polymerase-3 subunit gamma/tau